MPSDNIYENDPLNYEDFDDPEEMHGNFCLTCLREIPRGEVFCAMCAEACPFPAEPPY